jgi:hypothetical protein
MAAMVEGIERAALETIVRRALDDESIEVGEWTCRSIYTPFTKATGGVYRIEGEGWSVVLKVCRPPWWSPERIPEALAYGSGLLDGLPPGGIVAPRCFGVEERPDGSAWIWLEDVSGVPGEAWPIERYGLAARHLGRFTGAYLCGRPLPERQWLSRSWLRGYCGFPDDPAAEYEAAREQPQVKRWLPPELFERVCGIWADRERLFAALERLPQALAHNDCLHRNLIARTGSDETVAVDWMFVTIAGVGSELASLVDASVGFFGVDAYRIAELDEVALEGYLAGLRDAGWRGDARLVWLGHVCSAALRWATSLDPIGAPPGSEWALRTEASTGRPVEELYRAIRAIQERRLGQLDEARALIGALL